MDTKELAQGLHSLERKVLPNLSKKGGEIRDIAQASNLQEVEATRAVQWMSNKGLVKLTKSTKTVVELGKNGVKYAKEGLPEKRFLQALADADKALNFAELMQAAGLDNFEINISIGLLRKKVAIELDANKNITLTDQGKKLLEKGFLEEKFLAALKTATDVNTLLDEQKLSFDNLAKRKDLLKVSEQKSMNVVLTELGASINSSDIKDVIERVTPSIIQNKQWKNKDFRRYDVEINVPEKSFGRRHFVSDAIDYVRDVWLEMGFKEMKGTMVQTSFWNFDSLFTPQDHPVRDMQDTFFIKDPAKGLLPDKKIVAAVKNAHENGVQGSTGWQYKWSSEKAKKNILRTHTTVLSAQTIAKLRKENLPAKFFSVGKCFRNETVDYSHLFEFNQVEGIVIDPDANFSHLIAYLNTFFKKMGYNKVRFRPAYFPYTEPSVEVDVFDDKRGKWLELAGAGLFRPEVVEPLFGKDVNVLAWGPGFGRIIMEYCELADIRDLYKNDLKQLRGMKLWLK